MTEEEYMAMRDTMKKVWDIHQGIENIEHLISVINEALNYEFNIRGKPLLPYCDDDFVEDLKHKIIAHLEGKIKLLKQEFEEL